MIAVLVYKALNDLALQYLSDDCQLVTATSYRQLQSSNQIILSEWFFNRCVSYWNNLPPAVINATSLKHLQMYWHE